MLRNFVYNVCGCTGDWKMDSFVENNVKACARRSATARCCCALSGGVDSSVAAAMLAKAIGKQLTCVFVDHGLLRKNEKRRGLRGLQGGQLDINFVCVDARALPQAPRSAPDRSASARSSAKSSSASSRKRPRRSAPWISWHRAPSTPTSSKRPGGESAVIKSHHNVGGLPDYVDFKEIVEPLRDLFKDEVRQARP